METVSHVVQMIDFTHVLCINSNFVLLICSRFWREDYEPIETIWKSPADGVAYHVGVRTVAIES